MNRFALTVPITTLHWFLDSPDAGNPACLCSVCGEVIPVEMFPIRMYWQRDMDEVLEARFHDACLGQVSTLKVAPSFAVEAHE